MYERDELLLIMYSGMHAFECHSSLQVSNLSYETIALALHSVLAISGHNNSSSRVYRFIRFVLLQRCSSS
jgi:hypothetical protein